MLRMPRGRVGGGKQALLNLGGLALMAILTVAPVHEARAYIDPNSAGPLFQFLFPLLIAITSALAACRRVISQAWRRATTAILGVVRGGGASADLKDRIDPS